MRNIRIAILSPSDRELFSPSIVPSNIVESRFIQGLYAPNVLEITPTPLGL